MTARWRGPASWLPLLLGAAAAALYLRSLGNGFTFDDTYIIVDNPLVKGGAGLGEILMSHYWAAADSRGDLYRPLTMATYKATWELAGLAPWAYHLVNLMIHGGVTALVFLVARRLSGSRATAAIAGVLFAVHPVHVEAVASVVGRAELLAAMFVLGAWLIRDRPALSATLFACGLLSKENAIVLPGLLLAEDLVAGGRDRVRAVAWRRYAPALGVAVGFLALRFAVIGPHIEAADGPFVGVPAAHRLLTAADVLGRYLLLIVWPATLSADYSYDQIPIVTGLPHAGALFGAASALGCVVLAWLARRRLPAVSTGVAVFFVALLPVSNLLFGVGVVMAERLLYLPSAGACLSVAALLVAASRAAGAGRRRVVMAAACVAVCAPVVAMAAVAWTRTGDWRDQKTLFEATVRTSPRSALAHLGLGAAYQAEGRLDEAEAAYRQSLAIDPGRAATHYNLATLLERDGRREEAMREYHETVRIQPGHGQAHNNLGILYQDGGRLLEAEAAYRRAIATGPPRPAPVVNLATLLGQTGRRTEAIAAYREAIRLGAGEDPRMLNDLGRLLVAEGRAADAIEVLERAVAASGGAPTPSVNLAAAWLLTGDRDRARRLVTEVLRRQPGNEAARRVLEAADRGAGGDP